MAAPRKVTRKTRVTSEGVEKRAGDLLERILKLPGEAGQLLDRVESLVNNVGTAAREYKKTHWGRNPTKGVVVLNAADPNTDEVLPVLGELVSVVYLTRKGDDDSRVEYEHRFGKPRPLLCYANRQRGLLIIAGGRYTVTKRGIEG